MKDRLLDSLICPSCIPIEIELNPQVREKNGDDILNGSLKCSMCNARYPITDGMAFLIPNAHSENLNHENQYESASMISAYLWSHYADLFDDEDANTAYAEWTGQLTRDSGLGLDAGCAVGRFTFEMSRYCDFAVGIDFSRAFIRSARQLMHDRKLDIAVPEEGTLSRRETIRLPNELKSDKVEFIVGDIQALPFKTGSFSRLGSLNLVDKVPKPLVHLKEINRVARKKQAQFLFSDPFSWSTAVAEEKDWLGGTFEGPYSGRGVENIVALLCGEKGDYKPVWRIENKDHVWWKIRNHANHFELIRSHFINAVR